MNSSSKIRQNFPLVPIPPLPCGVGGGVGGWLSNDRKMTAPLHSPLHLPHIDKALLCVTFLLLPQTWLSPLSPLFCLATNTLLSSPPNQLHNELSFYKIEKNIIHSSPELGWPKQ